MALEALFEFRLTFLCMTLFLELESLVLEQNGIVAERFSILCCVIS